MAGCLFCRIANKELDSEIVHESDSIVAFKDINPAAPTHVLVIPKKHIASAQDLSSSDADLLAEMFQTMARLASESNLEGGHRIVTNVGTDAGQSVDHLHFHLIGGRQFSWPPG
ncbi:MAG: histidine triad nucleotide-binding protein [Actinomycetota bacterium]|nr:histidine triad nucleotide-binding protein [Actinomycetota bacterium]